MLHKENKGTTDDILYMKQSSFSVVFPQDVDECKESGGCKDKIAECHNTVGSFTCSCPKGYNSDYDGRCMGMCSFLYIHFNVHAIGYHFLYCLGYVPMNVYRYQNRINHVRVQH